jgi:hypothetical protein
VANRQGLRGPTARELTVRWAVVIGSGALAVGAVVWLFLAIIAPILWLTERSGQDSASGAFPAEPARPAERRVKGPAQALPEPGPREMPEGLASVAQPQAPRHTSKSIQKTARRAFVAGVNALGERLAKCPGRPALDGVGGPEAPQLEDLTVVILEVATRNGTMEVLDVPAGPNSSLGSEFVACAQQELRGQVMASTYPDGRNMQYPVWLPPTIRP